MWHSLFIAITMQGFGADGLLAQYQELFTPDATTTPAAIVAAVQAAQQTYPQN
jgi:hypothetical protein